MRNQNPKSASGLGGEQRVSEESKCKDMSSESEPLLIAGRFAEEEGGMIGRNTAVIKSGRTNPQQLSRQSLSLCSSRRG
jgi:hypothetical protein